MTRIKTLAANWKMNTLLPEALSLAKDIISGTSASSDVQKIIFPPFPFLQGISSLTSSNSGFATGAQNCSAYAKGAYTGEVSAEMIASVGAKYVLVGHSERRLYFRETADDLLEKCRQAMQAGLTVIYCLGESLDERRKGRHFEVAAQQLSEVLAKLDASKTEKLMLAYEPVWAIGTGETASPDQAQEMHAFIRLTLQELHGADSAKRTRILYGGSCNAGNAAELFACPDVDGGLIGGASLKAEEFARIVNSF